VEGNQTDIKAAVRRLAKRFNETVSVKYANDAEQMAKQNAPWEDKTGDARKLIKGIVINEEDVIGFGISHRVEYGKYLERDGDGKYAILKPTIEALRSKYFELARKVFGGGL